MRRFHFTYGENDRRLIGSYPKTGEHARNFREEDWPQSPRRRRFRRDSACRVSVGDSTMSQTERLVYITQCLRDYGRVDIRRVSERFEVDLRTVKRDIEYLRDRCDCPIEYDRKTRTYRSSKPVDIFSPGRYLLFYAYAAGMAKSLSLMPLVAKEIQKQAT